MHNFAKSNRWAGREERAEWWPRVYRKVWAGYRGHDVVAFESDPMCARLQRAGVDHIVYLTDGTTRLVDAKIRRSDFGDIALEYWSDHERRVKGWLAKAGAACSHIAYAILPAHTCHVIPFGQLRAAAQRAVNEGEKLAAQWARRFRKVEAHNRDGGRTWTTVSYAIPIDEIRRVVPRMKTVRW